MKLGNLVLKIVAAICAVAALVCCIIAFWDKIEEYCYRMRQLIAAKRCCAAESDDYEDWVD